MTQAVMQLTPTQSFGSSPFQMLNLNEVRLAGRLVQDPTVRSAIVGKVVVNLNLAVNRHYQDASRKWHKETAFVPVTVWNTMAGYGQQGLRKGTPLYVEGRLLSDTWKTLDGKRYSALKVYATRVRRLTKYERLDEVPTVREAGTLH